MTSRRDAAAGRQAIVVDLVAAIAAGQLGPGDPAPSLGSLARRYGISRPSVLLAIDPLLKDGTLQLVPSVGLFVGHVGLARSGCYVVVVESDRHDVLVRHPAVLGFEERVTLRGGTSAVLRTSEFLDAPTRSQMSDVQGVFVFTSERLDEVADAADGSPIVVYAAGQDDLQSAPSHLTYVDIDNEAGGRLAATDLLRDGHATIMFVGMHRPGSDLYPWSRQRAAGWAETMQRSRPRQTPCCVGPMVDELDPMRAARSAARAAVAAALEHDACVGADDEVVLALVAEFERRRVPQDRWPVLVGFEALEEAESAVVSSVRPSWSDVGARAADNIFDASRGRPRPAGQLERVGMVLIKRPSAIQRYIRRERRAAS